MKLQNGLSDRRKHTLYLMVFAFCDRDIAALTARLKLCRKALCPVAENYSLGKDTHVILGAASVGLGKVALHDARLR